MGTLLGSGNTRRLLDLGDEAARRVEELVLDRGPAAEVVDREQAARDRELRGVLLEDGLVDRAVAVRREDLLAGRRPEVLQERLGLRRVLGLRRHRDRVLRS